MTAIGLRRTRRPRLRLVPQPLGSEVTSDDERSAAGATASQRLGLYLVVVVALLSLLGSVMVLSASSVWAVEEIGSAFALTPYSGDLEEGVQLTYGSYLVTAVGLALGALE